MLRRVTTMPTMRRLSSQPVAQRSKPVAPAWLQSLTREQSAAPTLYAWTPHNIPGHERSGPAETNSSLSSSPGSSDRIYILGIGNLGRLYATALAERVEAHVTLVFHRKSMLEQWMANPGIEITRHGTKKKTSAFDVEWWTEEKPDVGPVREICDGRHVPNLIVTTKAPDALPQTDRLRRYLDARSTVAFVQNGMSKLWPPYGAEYSGSRFPPSQHPNWILCVTTHGVTSLGPFRSIHASPADVSMGPVLLNPGIEAKSEYLMDQIVKAPHLAAKRHPPSTLWVLQLEKLVVNSIINPLTALLRCKNGLLFSNPGGNAEKVMELLLSEASQVLQALVNDDSSYEIVSAMNSSTETGDVDRTRQTLLERFSTQQLRAMLRHVGEKVKDNTSSMLQDVTSGKQTEVREFNGWLVDTAGYLGIDATNHKTVCELVEAGLILEESHLNEYFPAASQS
ncbi:ketopantoate reductase PanE/ApbA C terminal-domain-containing protein [Podospora appendiculata]|uniref:Ketopantoate reductase PanE/ApbA C terminal-domain-containing protein n=1 Tax=Podospora appendiculata TaxID=314037 RepID=A0AAE1CEY4_9PEZI|nr:ketopantoate reductase PanE/ApbA C terminal-domain-containing protein [Podospora appendiculata]